MNDKLKRLIEKWRKFSASLESCFPDSCGAITRRCADELEAALSADPHPQLTDGDIKELLAMAWTLFNEPLPTARRKMMAYMEEIGYTRIAEAQPEAPLPPKWPFDSEEWNRGFNAGRRAQHESAQEMTLHAQKRAERSSDIIEEQNEQIVGLEAQVTDLTQKLLCTHDETQYRAKLDDIVRLEAQVNALRDVLQKLPLKSFGEDMEKCDAADFVDHAGQFFEAMLAARAALQPSPLSAKDSK